MEEGVPAAPRGRHKLIRRALVPAALGFVLLGSACGGSDDDDVTSPPPSGALGPVTTEAAGEAVLGLCELADATDAAQAEATFLDRAHETLHVIAAATEVRDRAAAASLLEAKQVVEADLSERNLPAGFGGDVGMLIGATRAALAAIGLDAPACPS
jgi:hypothetical protein